MKQLTLNFQTDMEPTGEMTISSSPVGSRDRASHLAQLENVEARLITATSGLKCFELYGSSARLGSLLKTLLASSAWTAGLYSNRYTLIWKAKATKFNRLLFQLSVSERRTDEIGFGLLHTPRAVQIEEEPEKFQARMGDRSGTTFPNLASQIMYGLLPTPAAQPPGAKNLVIVDKDGNPPQSHNERWYDQKTGRLIQKGLTQVIDSLLPTPKASNATGAGTHGDGGMDLQTTISTLLPTPRASEYKGTGPVGSKSHEYRPEKGYLDATIQEAGKSTGMKLQPNFVEFLMDYPQNWTIPNGGWSTKQLATTGVKKLDDALELIARKLATVSTEPKG